MPATIESVSVAGTSMMLGNTPLHASIMYREQSDPTDNEYAERLGFEDFMAFRLWLEKSYGLKFEEIFEGTVIYWKG